MMQAEVTRKKTVVLFGIQRTLSALMEVTEMEHYKIVNITTKNTELCFHRESLLFPEL